MLRVCVAIRMTFEFQLSDINIAWHTVIIIRLRHSTHSQIINQILKSFENIDARRNSHDNLFICQFYTTFTTSSPIHFLFNTLFENSSPPFNHFNRIVWLCPTILFIGEMWIIEMKVPAQIAMLYMWLNHRTTCQLWHMIHRIAIAMHSHYTVRWINIKGQRENVQKLPLNWIRPKFPLTITSCVNWWYVRHRYVCCASECDILMINNSPVGSIWYFPSVN